MSSIAVETSAQDARWRNFQQQVPWTHQQHQHQIQRQIHLQKLNSSGEEASESSETQEPSPPSSVDSSEKTPEEKLHHDTETWEHFEAQPTFLGTTVWEKRIPFDGQDFKLEYVDLEDFLAENATAIPVSSHPDSTFGISKVICHPSESNSNSNLEPSHQPFIIDHQFNIGISKTLAVPPPHSSPHLTSHLTHNSSRSSSPSDSSASGTSHDVSPDATQSQPPVLSAVPGHEFDPSSRAFSQAELKPQPIIKKSRKQFVPNEQKDAKYWVRRRKNNMAAKRSRDARRVKENQIAMRACFLENENHILKEEIERVQQENHRLKEEISRCHAEHH